MDAYIILYYFLIIPLLSLAASNDCPTTYCGQSLGIRFPFRLIDEQPETCGFPGFNLSCIYPSTVVLHLSSGDFAVKSIDYRQQVIRIYDPDKCLPAKLSKFVLSNSPFSASYYRNYTLLSCPIGANLSGFKPIDCLSNSSVSILAIHNESVVLQMTSNQTGCLITGNLTLPMANQRDQDVFTSQLNHDISLTWSRPNCGSCELFGRACGYVNSTTNKTICSSNVGDFLGAPKDFNLFRIIAFAMSIPAMTASIALACFMCNRRATFFNNTTHVTPRDIIVTTSDVTVPPPPPTMVGLDQETIESYIKVVLGESKRLPGHNDAVCPICLSEYNVKETVRCIPECLHCFHKECIDEWLKMNATCPICRNSPSFVHVESLRVC